MMYDCCIIGGGPAGLNAALVLGRARRKVALFDDAQPRNAVTHASHGFLTRDGVKPAEFRRIAYEEVLRYPSVEHWQHRVAAIRSVGSGFEVVTESGGSVRTKKVILAYGFKESFPEIAGFRQFYGQSLFNCPYCDGWELRDQALVVIAEEPRAFHMAQTVYNWSKDLVVCTNGHQVFSEEQKQELGRANIRIMEQPIAAFKGTDGLLEELQFVDGTSLQRTGGFIIPKLIPKGTFGADLGCELTEAGGVVTDVLGRSSVPGVYAAGDAAETMASQLIMAAAGGSKAAMAVNADLIEEEWKGQ
ncbi:thioredoxin reductase [Paenibacillus albidus]|uniref:Thioredoxin reductase n=1 Tax=Paenibacillus albidus TaxID=2041023 RepID=A0A917CQS2_9BACL|nr:NAD(P)/FAD-dependent oxidoreductase [Paenibacillus albidus]GGF94704.1 thioredoxin reductase [Paenibacillus albidus]